MTKNDTGFLFITNSILFFNLNLAKIVKLSGHPVRTGQCDIIYIVPLPACRQAGTPRIPPKRDGARSGQLNHCNHGLFELSLPSYAESHACVL